MNLPSTVSLTYDLNGNLLNDGTRYFSYDDENQLISVTVSNSYRSEFVYDGKMRRRQRVDYTLSGSAWLTNAVVRYIYDGNVVIQERATVAGIPQVTYTRGTDLSGTLQGAGGIGGLLARTDFGLLTINSTQAHSYYHADGNGNITMLINTNQAIVAKYLYDPFGNILSQSGSLADTNLYRFSSKEFHKNSGLVYYGYRFYDPNLQRWPNRDPFGEPGFETLHLVNQPLFIRKLRLAINDSEVQFLLAMAMQRGSIDVRSYLRNSHTRYAGRTISALAFLNILKNGQGNYAPNWPSELLETANLYDFVGNNPYNGTDPFGLWTWGGVWESTKNWLEALLEAIKTTLDGSANVWKGTAECGVGMTQSYTNAPVKNQFLTDPDNAPIPLQAGY